MTLSAICIINTFSRESQNFYLLVASVSLMDNAGNTPLHVCLMGKRNSSLSNQVRVQLIKSIKLDFKTIEIVK